MIILWLLLITNPVIVNPGVFFSLDYLSPPLASGIITRSMIGQPLVEFIDDPVELHQLKLSLQIIPLARIIPHEQTHKLLVGKVKRAIEREKCFTWPILVTYLPQDDLYVILDGHHRWKAARELGMKYLVCQVIQYDDPRITIGRWNRRITGVDSKSFSQSAAREGLLLQSLTKTDPVSSQRGNPLVYAQGKWYQVGEETPDPLRGFNLLNRLETWLPPQAKIEYWADENWRIPPILDNSIIIVPPLLTKKQVIKAAKARRVIGKKADRHLFHETQGRIVGGPAIPISWLMNEESSAKTKELNERLQKDLRVATWVTFPKGVTLLNNKKNLIYSGRAIVLLWPEMRKKPFSIVRRGASTKILKFHVTAGANLKRRDYFHAFDGLETAI